MNFQMVQDSLDNYTRDEQVDQLKREFLELEVEETKARAYNVDLKNKINQAVKRWLKEEEESKEVYLGKLSDFRRKTKKDELDALEQRKA